MTERLITTFDGQYVPEEHRHRHVTPDLNDLLPSSAKTGNQRGRFTVTVEFEPAGAALDASVGYKTGDIFVVKEHQTGHELYDPMINRHEILPRIITDGEHIQPGESCILISTNILYVQKRSSSYAGTHKQHATQVIQLMSSRGHVGWYSADSFEWQKLNGDKG